MEFEFNIDALESYVRESNIDAIAIANHNIFDLVQFREICSKLSFVRVFPGIEINLGENCGHILVITSPEDIEDFNLRCTNVSNKVTNAHEYLTIDDFKNIYVDLRKYLIIPHYDKKPHVHKHVLGKIIDYIESGEVNSVKKFIYCQRDENLLTPVYFSDYRAKASEKNYPIRQTYLHIDDINLKSIKLCLKDKRKVSLTEAEGYSMFYVLADLKISTGLNIMIGGRSSGKTYTLNQIFKAHENVKYIKQFELLEKDPKKAEEKFTEDLNIQQNKIRKDYFVEFSDVVDDIMDISIENDEKKIDKYLSSLIKNASETERTDSFSKCSLYSESEFSINNLNELKELIKSVGKLLDSTSYRKIIEKHVGIDHLINLYTCLIEEYRIEYNFILKKCWVNEVLNAIKVDLQASTAATHIPGIDFYNIQMNRTKVKKFLEVVSYLGKPRQIYRKEIHGFNIVAYTKMFEGAGEMKSLSKKKVMFSQAFQEYNNPYEFLQRLGEIDIDETSYYKYFVNVEFQVLNRYGLAVSGGDRAEFNLLKAINDALQYDMLIIDEPESSFDNLFLKERVNRLIKNISQEIPVVIATHNNTIGASIQPDYIIYTKREIENSNPIFKRFFGLHSSKYLIDNYGEKIPNINITLDCLEAGEDAYKERRENYEMLRSE